MNDFEDSFEIILGIEKEHFNWYNNSYIQIDIYHETSTGETLTNLKMKACSDIVSKLHSHNSKKKQNKICFEDKKQIKLKDSHEVGGHGHDYQNLVVKVNACASRTNETNDKQCESFDDIGKFMRENIFYVSTLRTAVDTNINDENADSRFRDPNNK